MPPSVSSVTIDNNSVNVNNSNNSHLKSILLKPVKYKLIPYKMQAIDSITHTNGVNVNINANGDTDTSNGSAVMPKQTDQSATTKKVHISSSSSPASPVNGSAKMIPYNDGMTVTVVRVRNSESLNLSKYVSAQSGYGRNSNGTKSGKTAALKRVSFGSSKGSMVETLVYDHNDHENDVTPNQKQYTCMMITSPPLENVEVEELNITDSGMDNPFRPGSELSREADIIVNLIKEGKPITPTKETIDSPMNANNVVNSSPGGGKGMNGTPKSQAPGIVEVQHGIVVPPNDASQVVEQIVIKKKRKCCVIQ